MKAHFKLNRAKIRFQNDKTHLRKAPGDRGFQMGKAEGLFSNCHSRKGIGHPGPLDQQGTAQIRCWGEGKQLPAGTVSPAAVPLERLAGARAEAISSTREQEKSIRGWRSSPHCHTFGH